MHTDTIREDGALRNHEEIVEVMGKELSRAVKSVGCDLRCFDWLSYNPDFQINIEEAKAV